MTPRIVNHALTIIPLLVSTSCYAAQSPLGAAEVAIMPFSRHALAMAQARPRTSGGRTLHLMVTPTELTLNAAENAAARNLPTLAPRAAKYEVKNSKTALRCC